MSEKRQKVSMIVMGLFLALAMTGLCSRLFFLHVCRSGERRSRIASNRRIEKNLNYVRGTIADRGGNILALDLVKAEVCADPAAIAGAGKIDEVSRELGSILDVPETSVARRIRCCAEKRFVYVLGYGCYVGADVADRIREQNIPGVFLREAMVRSYTLGQTLGPISGFVNLQGQGTVGIEQSFDRYLRGTPGLIVSQVDGRRRELYDRRVLEIRPRPGADVTLTIDQFIQYVAEQALLKTVEEQKAQAGWAVVMRVRTGEVLAMANYPTFDPNAFREAEQCCMRNRCIADTYEPGSTMKMAVVAAALNEGLVTTSDVFDCEHGMWRYGGRPLRDYHAYGNLSVADIIKKSSNIGAAKIALLLGDNRLFKYLRAFGVGRKTGIKLPGEEAGILHSPSGWSKISATRIAIGHEVALTALQMLNIANTIANNGLMMKPYIVRKVTDDDGNVLYSGNPQVLGRPIKPRTAAIMRTLLGRVTEDGGTGRRARVEGYHVAGKTGTAQKPMPGGYSDTMNMASFVGFVPADNPELAMIVVMDSPRRYRTGGGASAPVFKQVMEQALHYFDVPQRKTELVDNANRKPGVSGGLSL